jgi:hypothetical protein
MPTVSSHQAERTGFSPSKRRATSTPAPVPTPRKKSLSTQARARITCWVRTSV